MGKQNTSKSFIHAVTENHKWNIKNDTISCYMFWIITVNAYVLTFVVLIYIQCIEIVYYHVPWLPYCQMAAVAYQTSIDAIDNLLFR